MSVVSRINTLDKLSRKKVSVIQHHDEIIKNELHNWTTEELELIAFLSEDDEIPNYLKERLNKAGIIT